MLELALFLTKWKKSLSALDLYFLNLKNESIGLVGLKDLILEVAMFLEPLEVIPCVP